ncbi:hypothetical protein [Brevibacillus laterosporus]|uniref:hypothetical protein n=1 Tax=Brevibacillus laterosporus TaxID=1465 RepID=UPI00215B957A|nr:hypothetical protein [Brevibacillus laterosporus]MCR8994027.1 hypothetical protein [Brevibacillus laterosporus]
MKKKSFSSLYFLLICFCLLFSPTTVFGKHHVYVNETNKLVPFSPGSLPQGGITIIVKTSVHAAFQSKLTISGQEKWGQLIEASPRISSSEPEFIRAIIYTEKNRYLYSDEQRLFEQDSYREVLVTNSLRTHLEKWVSLTEQKHYGLLSPWSEVQQNFKRMAYGTVTDIESGEQFRVQRRAGSDHADVQPLTKQDTLIMKRIYQGKWSWKRRAILLTINGKHYAGSMHGMPHGGDGIPGNQFNGHFCIHFLGSSTHKRHEPDAGHQFMIQKAAGTLYSALREASPLQIIDYYLTCLREEEPLASFLVAGSPSSLTSMNDPVYVRERLHPLLDKMTAEEETSDMFSVTIPVKLSFAKKGKNYQRICYFTLVRGSQWDRWRIAEMELVGE